MKRQMIAAVTAAAVAMTATFSSPALADDRSRDALKILLGAAAIGLLVNQANKNKRKKEAAAAAARADHRFYDGNRYHDDWDKKRRHGHRGARLIPSECVFSIRGTRHRQSVVSERCLNEFGVARRVPRACAFDIQTRWGSRTVYGARCLENHGYRIADNRRW